MKLVKQIGFGIIMVSFCGMLGCGKSQPTAFEKLLQARAAPSASVPGSSQELMRAQQLWRDTYRDEHLKILAEMDRLLKGGELSSDPNSWEGMIATATVPLEQTFSKSTNPTILNFIKHLQDATGYIYQFARDIKRKAPLEQKLDAMSARASYKGILEKIDRELK